jgi:glyoxylase-like metal-dependent hydrolase (beta-lactamase superfamily II)
MALIEILENLFFIERGYLNGNHFVYRSDAPVLIDSGYISHFSDTEGFLDEAGVCISDVSLIISTHCHSDHIGGNRAIQEASGCDIALHRIGKHFIDTRDDWSTWWRYFDQEAAFFYCTRALDDGDEVDIGPHRFRVIHTPGHASDGIVLYNRPERLLISSDALWGRDLPVITTRIEGNAAVFQALDSLERIESLDVGVVYAGHGSPFRDVGDAVDRTRNKLKSYLRHREKAGEDLLKRIIVYTLLMKNGADADRFFSYLLETAWFRETVDLYFNAEYERMYHEIIGDFINRGIITIDGERMAATVKA